MIIQAEHHMPPFCNACSIKAINAESAEPMVMRTPLGNAMPTSIALPVAEGCSTAGESGMNETKAGDEERSLRASSLSRPTVSRFASIQ